MSSNNENGKIYNEAEKKKFTEVLSDKAEKAGEAAGDAVKNLTEMLTGRDDNVDFEKNIESHTEKLKTSDKDDAIDYSKNSQNVISNEIKTADYSKIKTTMFNVMLVLYDMFAVALAYFLALWIRFDGRFSQIPREYLDPYMVKNYIKNDGNQYRYFFRSQTI